MASILMHACIDRTVSIHARAQCSSLTGMFRCRFNVVSRISRSAGQRGERQSLPNEDEPGVAVRAEQNVARRRGSPVSTTKHLPGEMQRRDRSTPSLCGPCDPAMPPSIEGGLDHQDERRRVDQIRLRVAYAGAEQPRRRLDAGGGIVARVLHRVDRVVADRPGDRRRVDDRPAGGASEPKRAAQPTRPPQAKAKPSTSCGHEVTRFMNG